MSGDTKRVLEVNQIDNLQGSTQRVKQETTLNNLRGITQRVYVVGGGSAPVIDELNVTPSTSAQTITAPSGVDGYSPVNVSAVDSTIDANIVAGNIKKDVEILGVTGSYEGQVPTGTKSITANGVYDVTDFASADVQVPTTAPALYREFQLDGTGKLVPNTTTTHIMNFTGVTDMSEYVLYDAYYGNTAISGAVDMSDLTTISGQYACYNMFYGCTGLTSVDLSSLTTISGSSACGHMFHGCTGLTSFNLSTLTTINGSSACVQMFYNCTSLTTVYIGGTTEINFGTRTNQFTNMFQGCTQNIDVYAPAANQAKIESFSGYPKFGATGTVTWHWRS